MLNQWESSFGTETIKNYKTWLKSRTRVEASMQEKMFYSYSSSFSFSSSLSEPDELDPTTWSSNSSEPSFLCPVVLMGCQIILWILTLGDVCAVIIQRSLAVQLIATSVTITVLEAGCVSPSSITSVCTGCYIESCHYKVYSMNRLLQAGCYNLTAPSWLHCPSPAECGIRWLPTAHCPERASVKVTSPPFKTPSATLTAHKSNCTWLKVVLFLSSEKFSTLVSRKKWFASFY